MTFKIGDKVEVIKAYDGYKVGHIGVITSIQEYSYRDTYYRIDGACGGSTADFFKKVEDKPMFKVGAKVRITANTNGSRNKVGDIGVITEKSPYGNNWVVEVTGRKEESPHRGANTKESDMVLVEDDLYEDGWILNDGKVTIPDDAQKSMHEGSVVAFRKRKPVVFNFGDMVMYEGKPHLYVRKDRFNGSLVVIIPADGGLKSVLPNRITKV